MTRRRTLTSFLWILALALLVACGTGPSAPGNGDGDGDGDGDGNGNGTPTGDLSRIGFVSMEEDDDVGDDPLFGTDSVEGTGVFLHTDDGIDAGYLDDAYADLVDTCDVFDFSTIPEPGQPLPDVTFTYVGAGDAVTIDAAGTAEAYATLARDEQTVNGTAFVVYVPEEDLAHPMPTGLTATMPGSADFPAFADAAFPDVAALELTAPADTTADVDASTVFEWSTVGATDTSFVTFEVSTGTAWVDCVAADDGSFAFPTETVGELDPGFTGTLVTASRTDTEVVTHADGDAALYLSVNRAVTYNVVAF